jgi:methionyl-tRNA formyltransferase
MTKMSEQIVFFGSGPVAAKSLEMLINNFNVEAVITKPQKPGHSDYLPVLELAQKLGIKTYTALNRKELNNVFEDRPTKCRLAILIDYGIILSQDVIDYFPLGIVNSHFSLLPEWRGADPITFSILSGQEKTGVSLMILSAGLDEGPLLVQESIKLDSSIDSIELTQVI